MSTPSCTDCIHLQGTSQCSRPVPSYWNPATNQRRSRLCVPISAERSDRKVLGGGRLRCGPQAAFFQPKAPPIGGKSGTVIIDELAFLRPVHDTIGDSDGNDGA